MRGSLLAGIALIAASLAPPGGAPADLTAAASRKASPDFTLSDSQGHPVRRSAYQGRVLLLDFWATWCEGCKTEIPWYMEFQDKYQKAGLAVVGVAMDQEGWKSVRPFLAENKLNYPAVLDDARVSRAFGVSALPVTLLIDRNGRIADQHAGLVDKEAFEKEIQALLQDAGRRSDR